MAVRGSQQGVSRVQASCLKSVCEKHEEPLLSVDCTGDQGCLAGLAEGLKLSGIIVISMLQSLGRLADKQSSQLLDFLYTNFESLLLNQQKKAKPSTLLT